LVLPNPWPHHKEIHTSGLNLFNPLPFSSFKTLNNLILKIWPISRIIRKRNEKTKTIIIPDQEEITPNKVNLLGGVKIKGTRTPNGEIKTNAKEIITINFGQTSHFPFVVNTTIILTIYPK
jgi:hypothetical protein